MHVPASMRARDQWVLWRHEVRGLRDKRKTTKVPYSASGARASTADPSTWCSFDEAFEALRGASYDGVGFVFNGTGLVGIDLDHCRDPDSGCIDTWAQKVLEGLGSYTETSPSGTGLHVLVRGELLGKGKKRRVKRADADPKAAIEIYDRGRYFTVTGDRLPEFPAEVVDCEHAVAALYRRMSRKPRIDARRRHSPPTSEPTSSNAQIVERAMSAANGTLFSQLWRGDTSGHGGDHSAADLALCNLLAFQCGPNTDRIDALFRQSGLYREKWDRVDYRDATIGRALEGRTEFFASDRGGERGKPNRATTGADNAYVLIPGQHIDANGVRHEVGTDDFAAAVLERLPSGLLYRMDFVVGELVGLPGARRFVTVTDQRIRALVDTFTRLAKWVNRKDRPAERVFVACSRDQAGVILAAVGVTPRVPELRLLVHHPVFQPDLTLARAGWNQATGIFYDESPELRGLIPNAKGARDVLRDLVVDFPFKDEASRQNVFGAMLTLIVRPAIVGKVPFHLVMSSMERTGKGKLIDTAFGEAVLGRAIAPMQPGRTEDEREKRVTSLLLQGETVVHIDNLPVGDVVDSAALASLATSWPNWRGRLLGVSRAPLLANNLIVFLSGNNPRTTGEIAKRTVPIALQPTDDHPEDRCDFVHEDAEGYARGRRRAVLEALIGLVESWKVAGRPPTAIRRTVGGFDGWARLVGDVLANAGMTEWMSNFRSWVHGSDEWTGDAEVLVQAWAERFSASPVRTSEVLTLVKSLELFPAVTGKATTPAQLSSLGKRVMTPLTNRPVGRWQVVTSGKGASKRYQLREHLPSGTETTSPTSSDACSAPEREGSER